MKAFLFLTILATFAYGLAKTTRPPIRRSEFIPDMKLRTGPRREQITEPLPHTYIDVRFSAVSYLTTLGQRFACNLGLEKR